MIHSIQALWLGMNWQMPMPAPQLGPDRIGIPEGQVENAMNYGGVSYFGDLASIDMEPRRWRT